MRELGVCDVFLVFDHVRAGLRSLFFSFLIFLILFFSPLFLFPHEGVGYSYIVFFLLFFPLVQGSMPPPSTIFPPCFDYLLSGGTRVGVPTPTHPTPPPANVNIK